MLDSGALDGCSLKFKFQEIETMSRLNRITLITALALSGFASVQAATVAASEAEARKAIEARQHVFDQIKDLNDALGKMLKKQSPMDPAVVATNAAKIQTLAGQIPGAFKVDTRGFKGIKTAALDGIWASEADFKTKADALAAAAGEAVAAGKSGSADASQKALIALGKTCGNCHDSYRAKMD
jgi:cytochrome c556